MKSFGFTAACTFDAEDIDDAFMRLALHFNGLRLGYESSLLVDGYMTIKPLSEEAVEPSS